MKNTNRANIDKLTKLWDKGELKDCYCLIFSNVWGFTIIWNDENGQSHGLKNDSKILERYFVVLSIFETEEQAKEHFKDYIKWSDVF